MPIINEISMGAVPDLNGMTMFRKYDGENGFKPYFKFIDDNTLSMDSNIIVNYIEYYKNSSGVVIKELTKYKYYVVPNIPAVLYKAGDIITPAVLHIAGDVIAAAVLYVAGETITPVVLYVAGEIITPDVLYIAGETMANGLIANGGEIKTPAVIANGGEIKTPVVIAIGTEIKTPAVLAIGTEIKKAAWLGANRWFLSVARTPMTAPYGIMDGIEWTLAGLPIGIPNGYVLQGSL